MCNSAMKNEEGRAIGVLQNNDWADIGTTSTVGIGPISDRRSLVVWELTV